MTLAAEREVDRLDRIDQLAEEARIAIGRSEFRKARSKIDRLAEIGGPPGTVRFLEGRLDHSLRKVRTTQQARVVQPQPLRTVVPPPVLPRRTEPPKVVKTGPGALKIQFSSNRPRGVLTVFANGSQVLNRRYRFMEKKNFIVRKGIGGSFQETIELPEGRHTLKLYLTQPKLATQHRPLTVRIPAGETATLVLRVRDDGKLIVEPR